MKKKKKKKDIFCLQESIWLLFYLFKKEIKEKKSFVKMRYTKNRKNRDYTSSMKYYKIYEFEEKEVKTESTMIFLN